MINCEKCRQELAEHAQARNGEPQYPRYVQMHLAHCSECRGYTRRLVLIDEALRERPLARPSPELPWRIMRSVEQVQQEEWQMLPWTIWLPTLTITISLIIAASSLSSNQLSAQEFASLEHSLSDPQSLSLSRLALRESDAFQALWIGLSAIISGLGISLGVNSFREAQREYIRGLRGDIQDRASRLLSGLRHAS